MIWTILVYLLATAYVWIDYMMDDLHVYNWYTSLLLSLLWPLWLVTGIAMLLWIKYLR